MQTIQNLEARALRRADAVDELDRSLYAAKGRRRTQDLRDEGAGLWAGLKRLFLPNRLTAMVEKLEAQQARARAALQVAVDELHQAHCQQLRAAPWSGTLLAPTEAGLRDANQEYHPWDRVQMSGKRALRALHRIDAPELDALDKAIEFVDLVTSDLSDDINREIEAMNQAGDAVRSFVNALGLLAREHPETGAASEVPALTALAVKLSGVRTRIGAMAVSGQIDRAKQTIAAIMNSVAQSSGAERGEVALAQGRLEEVNHQIDLAAWSKIPARLRPPGR